MTTSRPFRFTAESADEVFAVMLGDDLIDLVGRLQQWGAAIRAAHGYYPSSPQEAVLSPGVNSWMRRQQLPDFGGGVGPVTAAARATATG